MLLSRSCLLQAGEVFLDCHGTVVVGRALSLPSLEGLTLTLADNVLTEYMLRP